MGAELLLSPAEVAELTGAARSSGQMEWFAGQGIPAALGKDGRVKVLRAAMEAKLMPGGMRHRSKTEPNLTLLKKAS